MLTSEVNPDFAPSAVCGQKSEILGWMRENIQRETCPGELTVHHCVTLIKSFSLFDCSINVNPVQPATSTYSTRTASLRMLQHHPDLALNCSTPTRVHSCARQNFFFWNQFSLNIFDLLCVYHVICNRSIIACLSTPCSLLLYNGIMLCVYCVSLTFI